MIERTSAEKEAASNFLSPIFGAAFVARLFQAMNRPC